MQSAHCLHIQLRFTLCDHKDNKYVAESVREESQCMSECLRVQERKVISVRQCLSLPPPSLAAASFWQHLKTGRASVVKCCCFQAPLSAYTMLASDELLSQVVDYSLLTATALTYSLCQALRLPSFIFMTE